MRRLALPLALLALTAGPARAEIVFAGPVTDARLALRPDGTPVAAFITGSVLSVAARTAAGGWPAAAIVLPSSAVEIDGLAVSGRSQATVLVRERGGRWLGVVTETSQGWRARVIAPDARGGLVGPAGLVLDGSQRPAIAYALWLPSHQTFLRLVRTSANGGLSTTRITRGGFPSSPAPPSAAPVLLPTGRVHVIETYPSAAIEWSPIPGDWQGQFLRGTALGVPGGRIEAGVLGSTVYAAWTEAFPTLGPPGVVLASHAAVTHSAVAIENAVLAGLALTPDGPELAANRCVPAAEFGLDGNGVCGGLVGGTGLDGIVAGFAAGTDGTRELLLVTAAGLDWYRSPGPLQLRVQLNPDLTGHVDGAAGGSVTLYRERPGATRVAVGTFPVASDGSFTASDPTATAVAAAYRAVYVDPETSLPYAALIGPNGSVVHSVSSRLCKCG